MLRRAQVHAARLRVALEQRDEVALGIQCDRDLDQRSLAALDRLGHVHDALAHGGHLRQHVRAHDGGDDVAAQGRADLQQLLLVEAAGGFVGADLEVGAIGGQPGLERRGDARGQVAAQGRGAVEHDLRLPLADQRR